MFLVFMEEPDEKVPDKTVVLLDLAKGQKAAKGRKKQGLRTRGIELRGSDRELALKTGMQKLGEAPEMCERPQTDHLRSVLSTSQQEAQDSYYF